MPMLRAHEGHGRRRQLWLRRGGDGHKVNRRVRPVYDDHVPRWQEPGGLAAAGWVDRPVRCVVLGQVDPGDGRRVPASVHRLGLVAQTVETVRFTRPERVDFRLVRGPVPHVVEAFVLTEAADGSGTRLAYDGEIGADGSIEVRAGPGASAS